uniref:Flavoprotein domain-containing protein n=1 Tax=Maylandia zebra TaxID=106582 RepID=A0A3P9CUL1_9CICH
DDHMSSLKTDLLKTSGTFNVLVGVTGSVAALKLPLVPGIPVVLFCPAMNTAMWLHPITAQQVSRLKEFGYVEIPCVAKKLVSGDEGKGAMAEVSTIVSLVKEYLQKPDESSLEA